MMTPEDVIVNNLDSSSRVQELENENHVLKNKLKVLKIQLESQSHLHATGCPYSRKKCNINSRIYQSTSAIHTGCNKSTPKELFKMHKNHNGIMKNIPISQYETMSRQLHIVNQDFQQSQSRIFELEQELAKKNVYLSPSKVQAELCENVEIIKLKRICKKQSADISALQIQLNGLANENKQLHSSVNYYNEQRENLLLELSKEKNESTKLSSELLSVKSNIRLLEEQIKDIENEKLTLKQHNENLLKLSLQLDSSKLNSDTKLKFFNQIQQLEESLKTEILAKSNLITKLANAESLLSKFQDDGNHQSSTILHLQKHNSFLRDQYAEINDKYRRLSSIDLNDAVCAPPKEDKFTMTIEGGSLMCNQNTESYVEDKQLESTLEKRSVGDRLQLSDALKELSQCKELLKIQYEINKRYKKQVEELERMFYNIEATNNSNLKIIYDVLENHKNQLRNILSSEKKTILNDILVILGDLKLPNSKDNNLKNLTLVLKLYEQLASLYIAEKNPGNSKFVSIGVNSDYENMRDKYIQINLEDSEQNDEIRPRRGSYTIENPKQLELFDHLTVLDRNLEFVKFELNIEKAEFEEFPTHLKQSENGEELRIFLTWIFFNEYEQQSYTCSRSISNSIFDCTCTYEGQSSQEFLKYLKEDGVHVEVHLIQGDISVRIADSIINISSALLNIGESCDYLANLEGVNVKGNIRGWFKLVMSNNIDSN